MFLSFNFLIFHCLFNFPIFFVANNDPDCVKCDESTFYRDSELCRDLVFTFSKISRDDSREARCRWDAHLNSLVATINPYCLTTTCCTD